VEEIHGEHGPDRRRELREGMANGVASLKEPNPAIAALLSDAETVPDWVDPDLIEHGPRAFFTTPSAVHLVSLTAGALIRIYMSPTISLVLAATGRLVDQADRRVRETGMWVGHVVLPGGLRAGSQGYRSTLQVRMLHAHMRRMVRLKGFDVKSYGLPINQVDLARTWMDFTLTSMKAETIMGYDLTIAEEREIYVFWNYLAHLLGIDPRLVNGISNNEEAERVDQLIEATTGQALPESVLLAKHTVKTVGEELHKALGLPTGSGEDLMEALARRFHGDRIADALELKRHSIADGFLTPAIALIRDDRRRLRKSPEKWTAAIEKELEGWRNELQAAEQDATFQKAAAGQVPGT
jgi:hypothetical protein